MEQVRDAKLDNICEGINDARATKNSATQEEQSLIASALERMQKRGTTVYKHGGVELARVPGSEKLRVRLTKDEGDASVDGGRTSSQNAGEDVEESTGLGLGEETIE